jgi:CRISPR/Cas system CSM-associated protein Csm3 (group 7 of RAMP superfamily)
MSVGLLESRLRRLDFFSQLVTLTPIHIGSGHVGVRNSIRDGEEQKSEIGLFSMAEGETPWLPPTAMKGLLRRLDRGGSEAVTSRLFGQINNDSTGAMGALLVRGGRMKTPGQALGRGQRDGSKGATSVLTRTAIDAGRGISDRNKLFSREIVGTGAEFDFRMRLECSCAEAEFDTLKERVLELLGRFTATGDACLGADTKLGLGRLAMKSDSIKLVPWVMESTGALKPSADQFHKLVGPPTRDIADHSLTLRCEFPFFILDSHHERDADKLEPHLIPLREGTKAVVSPSSVLGVLRARADWLFEVARMTGAPFADGLILEFFGSKKRKGRLSLRVAEENNGKPDRVTSVKLDRFTGAPIEQGLFEIEAETMSFRLDLRLANASEEGRRFLPALVQDVRENGLQIGHATTRGYGWFRVEGG